MMFSSLIIEPYTACKGGCQSRQSDEFSFPDLNCKSPAGSGRIGGRPGLDREAACLKDSGERHPGRRLRTRRNRERSVVVAVNQEATPVKQFVDCRNRVIYVV